MHTSVTGILRINLIHLLMKCVLSWVFISSLTSWRRKRQGHLQENQERWRLHKVNYIRRSSMLSQWKYNSTMLLLYGSDTLDRTAKSSRRLDAFNQRSGDFDASYESRSPHMLPNRKSASRSAQPSQGDHKVGKKFWVFQAFPEL